MAAVTARRSSGSASSARDRSSQCGGVRPGAAVVVRRRDVTVEVDRSQEFSADSVLIRGKVRATLFLPHTEVVRINNVPAPDPAVTV